MSEQRLLRLMLYKLAGGTGYNLAIDSLAKENQDFYNKITSEIEGIQKELADQKGK